MQIPEFVNGLLPPHPGNPADRDQGSPYRVTALDVFDRFSTSPERCQILSGWLNFRAKMRGLGISKGHQWLDGSFCEDVESRRGRAPRDLDAVTFFYLPPGIELADMFIFAREHFEAFLKPSLSKQEFRLDHYAVCLDSSPEVIMEQTRYWSGLFSHTRDREWKGMLRVDLGEESVEYEREAARLLLS